MNLGVRVGREATLLASRPVRVWICISVAAGLCLYAPAAGASSVGAAAAPDQTAATFASAGKITEVEGGCTYTYSPTYIGSVDHSGSGGSGWLLAGSRSGQPARFGLSFSSGDHLRTITAMDLYVPDGAGTSNRGFEYKPSKPFSLFLDVGQSSTGKWFVLTSARSYTLTATRTSSYVWKLTVSSSRPYSNGEIGYDDLSIVIDQSPVKGYPQYRFLQLSVHGTGAPGTSVKGQLSAATPK